MCGICLLIRQKIATATPARGDTANLRPAPSSAPHPAPSSSTLPVDDQLDAQATALLPTSADTHSLTPCGCALAGLDVRNFLSGADGANGLFKELIHNLRRRGPDTYGVTRRSFVTTCRAPAERNLSLLMGTTSHGAVTAENPHVASFSPGDEGAAAAAPLMTTTLRTEVAGVASVLGLRGHSTVAQPYDMNVAADADDDRQANSWDYRSSLLWNGEIFGGALCPPPWGSDTVLLATRLSQMELECVRLTHSEEKDGEEDGGVAKAVRQAGALLPLVERQRIFLRRCTTLFEQQVEGPYSFIFIATRLRLAVFGRDPLGRHSLLSHVRVTRPVAAAAATTTAKTATAAASPPPAGELDVELIVSSVGVQHHGPCTCHTTVNPEEGRHQQQESEGGEQKADPAAPASPPLTPSATCKRPRHETGGVISKSTAAAAVEDEEDAAGGVGGGGGGAAEAAGHLDVCWQEVGVTGLFAVPLQAPLVYGDSSPSGNAAEVAAAEDRQHPVCVSESHRSSNGGSSPDIPAATMVRAAHVLLLHCPWQRAHHLVHPLLRTAGLPMVQHEPPSFELILAHEEIAVLPEPLLRWTSHLMKSMQPDGGVDQSWVDWAAAHYMLALAVSMHRRITVANSGAADGRDAQELSTARRRPLCILFSGGIDCTVIAALAHYLLPVETPIELVNVAFGDSPAEAPDRVAAFRSMEELLRLPLLSTSRSADSADAAEREWRLVLVDVPSKTTADGAHIKDLLVPRHTVMDLDIGTALWYAARASGRMQVLKRSDVKGVGAAVAGGLGSETFDGTPPLRSTVCSPTSASATLRTGSGSPTVTLEGFSKHFRAYTGATAVGASGPLDGATTAVDAPFPTSTSTVMRAGQQQQQQEQQQLQQQQSPTSSGPEEVAASTLKYQILVDVLVKEGRSGGGPLTPVLLSTLGKEYSLFLQPHIKRYGYKKLGSFLNDAAKAGYIHFVTGAPSKAVRLCRPSDMERATAEPPSAWFTTAFMRAQAPRHDEDGVELPALPCPGTFDSAYTSHAKVVLLGMGADETLGGYTRYRRVFQREGMAGAQRELECDFARLWQRNLGRDDRVTMDSGREPRFPFLDEGVLRTLEWIVLKRRNHIIAAHEQMLMQLRHQQHQQQLLQPHHHHHHFHHHNRNGINGGGVAGTALHHSHTSSIATGPRSALGGAAAAAAAVPPLKHDELLRLALEPIVSFRLQPGEGDKRVLRRVARVLGLSDVANLQKRAIQFGSRIAERKIKGTTEF